MNVNQSVALPVSNILSEVIVALAILQMILSATIPSLKIFQIPVEIILLLTLSLACATIKYDRLQLLLLFVFVFCTAVSFTTTELAVFSVNAKQNGIAVLSLIYFSKVSYKSKLIFPAVVTSILLLILNALTPELVRPFIALSFNEAFNMSRFGGLFLNAHFNAFFLAVALLYYGQLRHLYGIGAWVIYFTASKFIFVSYILSLLTTLPIRYFRKYHRSFALAIILSLLIGVYFFVNYSDMLIEFFIEKNRIEVRHNSVIVILSQLADPVYYEYLLNLLPAGQLVIPEDITRPFTFHSGNNEIGFFALAAQSGIILGGLYLFVLIKHARFYTVFILVSLLHNNFILSPLVVYMFVTYSREVQLLRDKYTVIHQYK